MIIKSFLWTLSIYPTLLSTVTATGQTIPSLSASSAIPSASPPPPAVHLLAPNWTRLDASGPRNRIQWGGFGRSDILSGIASLDWEFKMDGKKWWLEVFDMKVLKPTGDWLAMTNEQWNAQAAANVEATKTLKVSRSWRDC